MAIFKIKESHIRPLVSAITAVFILLAAGNALAGIPHQTLCLAVGALCLGSLWLTPWEISLALLFSAIGDLFGSYGNLLAQMGSFAAAHISYIYFFVRRYHRKVEHDRKLTEKAKGYMMMTTLCTIALLILFLAAVVPEVPAGIIRTGVSIYSIIICFMLITALLQRSMLYALGALFFVISDFLLAWNMFVHQIPHASAAILCSYFIAQWLIFIRATPYRVPHPVHLLRF